MPISNTIIAVSAIGAAFFGFKIYHSVRAKFVNFCDNIAPLETTIVANHFPFIASNRNFYLEKVDGNFSDYPNDTENGILSYHSFPDKSVNPVMVDYDTWMSQIVKRNGSRVMIFIHGYQNSWGNVTKTWDSASDPNTYGLSGMVTNFYALPEPLIAPNT